MIVDETVKQCAAPFSQPTIDELRAVADAHTSPACRQLLNLQLDVQLARIFHLRFPSRDFFASSAKFVILSGCGRL